MNYAQQLLWHHVYDVGLRTPVPRVGPGFRLTIPGGAGKIAYVWTQSPVNLYPPGKRQASHAISISATITMSEGAIVTDADEGDTGTMPPTMRLMLCRSMNGMNNRWYGEEGIEITPGAHTLTVPLDTASWRNVLGKYPTESPGHLRDFNVMLQKSLRLGVVFGAGNDYGHAVRMETGTCQIQVTSYVHRR